MSGPKLAYRLATKADLRLVVDSWVSSYRTAHAAGMIAMDDWRAIMCSQVSKVIARPDVEVWVAYKPGELPPADLYGWIAVERGYDVPIAFKTGSRWDRQLAKSDTPLVHYLYVIEGYRGCGLSRRLFAAAGVNPEKEFLYSCKTGFVTKLASKIPLAKWMPLIARYPKKAESHEQRP